MTLVEDGLAGLGGFIKQRRTFLGLSQAELARQLGVNQSTVHRLEAGERFPSSRLLLRLLEVLRADLRDINR